MTPLMDGLTSDWFGVALGLVILIGISRPGVRGRLINKGLFRIALPFLVIGALSIVALALMGLDDEFLRYLIPAIIAVLGWFITFSFQEERRHNEKIEDQRELTTAFLAEIDEYDRTFSAFGEGPDSPLSELLKSLHDDPEARPPFITVEREPQVFLKLAPSLHHMPELVVRPVVQFYSRLEDVRGFAAELNSDRFLQLPLERRLPAYEDYYGSRSFLAKSAKVAREELEKYLFPETTTPVWERPSDGSSK